MEAPGRPESARPTGRRSGVSGTRDAILVAARQAFAARGYRSTTIRAIAGAAEVDAALVHHFFGTKDELFAAAMSLPSQLMATIDAAVAEGDLDCLGERIAWVFVQTWDDAANQPALLGVLRAAVADEASMQMARDFVTTQILTRVGRRLPEKDRRWRTALLGSQLVGLGMARYVLRIEPLASAAPADVVAAVAPNLQRYLTEDLAGESAVSR